MTFPANPRPTTPSVRDAAPAERRNLRSCATCVKRPRGLGGKGDCLYYFDGPNYARMARKEGDNGCAYYVLGDRPVRDTSPVQNEALF